jgi:hypothetical protein
MDMQRILHIVGRVLFIGASAAILLAILEFAVEFFGTSLIGYSYSPGRLLELSAALLVFVMTILLWDIRNKLSSDQS